ncbi:acyltransferase family protein [Salipiger pacificus]|uniref:Acyltransferase family protein n=2 Tax=Salipiger mangrovisoli TaxID=2865933 RepID=A0ABR9XAG1_9RHOB|nr:acyltransferase family protein [Salipiger mangrovisoli]
MPLLMFLSGMLLHRGLAKSNKAFLLGKFAKIFWPFLLWSVIIYAAEGRMTLEFILKTPISAPSLLWYLWFLSAYYVMSLALDRWSIPILPVIVVAIAASSVLPDLLRMSRFAYLLSFFLLGHLVATRNLSMEGRVLFGLAGLTCALTGAIISILQGNVLYDPRFVWVPLGMIAFVLWAAPRCNGGALWRSIEWVGRNSIVFYVSHFPIQLLVARHAQDLGIANVNSVLAAVLLVSLCGGALLQVVRTRYAIFAALFDLSKSRDILGALSKTHLGKSLRLRNEAR